MYVNVGPENIFTIYSNIIPDKESQDTYIHKEVEFVGTQTAEEFVGVPRELADIFRDESLSTHDRGVKIEQLVQSRSYMDLAEDGVGVLANGILYAPTHPSM